MKPKVKTAIYFGAVILILAALLTGIILVPGLPKGESVGDTMQDAVLHERAKVSLFGLMDVNPAVISAFIVTAVLLIVAALLRIFAIPKFKTVPGKLQIALEKLVGFFDDLAKTNSHYFNRFIGAYIFGAGIYIFIGTLFELLGIQVVDVVGESIALPAPLTDINAAISIGVLSYLVICGGGLFTRGLRGLGRALKDFSLPISMSFRLFGALLSGLIVTELVYYYSILSLFVPVIVGILFTLLHAVIQTYVLTTLTSMFYGETTEPLHKRSKRQKSHDTDTQAVSDR